MERGGTGATPPVAGEEEEAAAATATGRALGRAVKPTAGVGGRQSAWDPAPDPEVARPSREMIAAAFMASGWIPEMPRGNGTPRRGFSEGERDFCVNATTRTRGRMRWLISQSRTGGSANQKLFKILRHKTF